MFRRLWKGLPEEPVFPDDLKQLGYFVNEDDEIRSIENPKHYFKYFINKNMHWNDRQRFSFNSAVERLVLGRLADLGLDVVRLPLGAAADEPHVPVLATGDLATAQRIVVFVGETAQDLGILAHRVVGGPGGVDKGSLVSMIKALRHSPSSPSSPSSSSLSSPPPAILVLNPGQLFWWPEGRRALSLPAVLGLPRPSAAHQPPRTVPGQNVVPGHATAGEHVASALEALVGPLLPRSRITAIALAGGADALEGFLDAPGRWPRWGPHLDSLVLVGGLYEAPDVQTAGFRQFLRQRARAYAASLAPVDTPIAGADGNEQTAREMHYGCPVHSSGPSWLTELMFIDAQAAVLAWGDMVARSPGYANPEVAVTYADHAGEAANSSAWENGSGGWDEVDENKATQEVETEASKITVAE